MVAGLIEAVHVVRPTPSEDTINRIPNPSEVLKLSLVNRPWRIYTKQPEWIIYGLTITETPTLLKEQLWFPRVITPDINPVLVLRGLRSDFGQYADGYFDALNHRFEEAIGKNQINPERQILAIRRIILENGIPRILPISARV